MLCREKESPQAGRELKEILSGLEKELGQAPELWGSDQEACVSRSGVPIRCGMAFTKHEGQINSRAESLKERHTNPPLYSQ